MILRLHNTKKGSFQSQENDLKCYVLVLLVHLQIVGYANGKRCVTFFEKKRRVSTKLINLQWVKNGLIMQMQNIYLIYIKLDRKWAICLHMEAQQYLGIQQTFVTTFSNHIDQWSMSGVCWIGIIIYHIQRICDFPLTKDIPATIYENNYSSIEWRIQLKEIRHNIFHLKSFSHTILNKTMR